MWRTKSQLEKIRGNLRFIQTVSFVHRDAHRAITASQCVSNFYIDMGQAIAAINQKNDRIGFIDRLPGLRLHARIEHFRLAVQTTRIYCYVAEATQLAVAIFAITSQTGIVRNKRITRFGQFIEES